MPSSEWSREALLSSSPLSLLSLAGQDAAADAFSVLGFRLCLAFCGGFLCILAAQCCPVQLLSLLQRAWEGSTGSGDGRSLLAQLLQDYSLLTSSFAVLCALNQNEST